jgi:hypothetical protein
MLLSPLQRHCYESYKDVLVNEDKESLRKNPVSINLQINPRDELLKSAIYRQSICVAFGCYGDRRCDMNNTATLLSKVKKLNRIS